MAGMQQSCWSFGYFHARPTGNLLRPAVQTRSRWAMWPTSISAMMDSINDADRLTLTAAVVHLINRIFLSPGAAILDPSLSAPQRRPHPDRARP